MNKYFFLPFDVDFDFSSSQMMTLWGIDGFDTDAEAANLKIAYVLVDYINVNHFYLPSAPNFRSFSTSFRGTRMYLYCNNSVPELDPNYEYLSGKFISFVDSAQTFSFNANQFWPSYNNANFVNHIKNNCGNNPENTRFFQCNHFTRSQNSSSRTVVTGQFLLVPSNNFRNYVQTVDGNFTIFNQTYSIPIIFGFRYVTGSSNPVPIIMMAIRLRIDSGTWVNNYVL